MISVNDIRRGTVVEYEGGVFQVLEFLHVKPGKGAAFVRAKLKNLRTGAVIDTTFNAGEKLPKANINRQEYQYLYAADGFWTFMNTENYEQVQLNEAQVGEARNFLLENMNVYIVDWNGTVIGLELPNTVELEVAETEPGFAGDTATGASKDAVLQTGYKVKVPLFINVGDRVKIDTRSGEYLGRA